MPGKIIACSQVDDGLASLEAFGALDVRLGVELPALGELAAEAQAADPAAIRGLRAENVAEVRVDRQDAEVPPDLAGQEKGRIGVGGARRSESEPESRKKIREYIETCRPFSPAS